MARCKHGVRASIATLAIALLFLTTCVNDSEAAAAAAKLYKRSVVKKHNKTGDCWMIYSGGVYNLNGYLKKGTHPGGNSYILPYCGKDGTAAFKRNHRAATANLLKRYKVGKAIAG